jgi:hypothetical protein
MEEYPLEIMSQICNDMEILIEKREIGKECIHLCLSCHTNIHL